MNNFLEKFGGLSVAGIILGVVFLIVGLNGDNSILWLLGILLMAIGLIARLRKK